jgi:hypothetical protein
MANAPRPHGAVLLWIAENTCELIGRVASCGTLCASGWPSQGTPRARVCHPGRRFGGTQGGWVQLRSRMWTMCHSCASPTLGLLGRHGSRRLVTGPRLRERHADHTNEYGDGFALASILELRRGRMWSWRACCRCRGGTGARRQQRRPVISPAMSEYRYSRTFGARCAR